MFKHVKSLQGYKLKAIDGQIGKIDDFYFDEKYWTIRYLVDNSGGWLKNRQLLVSPYAVGEVSQSDHQITIKLTKQQIVDSPPLAENHPVSKDFERDYHNYYGWPAYWYGSSMWGADPFLNPNPSIWKESLKFESWDSHLRSTNNTNYFSVHSTDGKIGSVRDFLVTDSTWTIRYLVVDAQKWWPGNYLLISPQWLYSSNWDESKFIVNLSREQIKTSPPYFDDIQLTREYEAELYKHYNRNGYWDDETEPDLHEHSSWRSHSEPDQGLRMF
jgi:hypothetical protein